MSIPGHVHVTEREGDGTWENCTECSGLEFYRDAIDSSVPATHAEAEALRTASGRPATGGSNLDDLRKAIRSRYGKDLPPAISNKDILAHLAPGWCAVLQGNMSAFGPTNYLSKWDPRFDGGHAVYLANYGGHLLWCDPEAPAGAAVPVVISPADVTKFVNAFNGQAIVAPIKTPPVKETPVDLVTYLPGYTAKVKAQSNIRRTPLIAGPLVMKTLSDMPAVVIGTVVGDKDPANQSTVWYAMWGPGGVTYTAKDNIIGLTAPAPAPISTTPAYPDVRVALAAALSERDAMQARLAVVEPEAAQLGALKTAVKNLLS